MATKDRIIGLGELCISTDANDVIKTFALGSCVALIAYDYAAKAAAMAHFVLPDSRLNAAMAAKQPAYFADTGLPLLLADLRRRTGNFEPRKLLVKIAGGAQVMNANAAFNVGGRNVLAVKELLKQSGIVPLSEDTGGNMSRTVSIAVDTGLVTVYDAARRSWTL